MLRNLDCRAFDYCFQITATDAFTGDFILSSTTAITTATTILLF